MLYFLATASRPFFLMVRIAATDSRSLTHRSPSSQNTFFRCTRHHHHHYADCARSSSVQEDVSLARLPCATVAEICQDTKDALSTRPHMPQAHCP
jgi:hypothetical protein